MAILLALAASIGWGTSDFIGGTVSRRMPPQTLLLLATASMLPVLTVVAVVSGDLRFGDQVLIGGVVAGLGGGLGIVALYRGLASGTMGVVAPISSTAVIVPVIVGVASGDELGILRAGGIVAAIVGVVLAGGLHPGAVVSERGPVQWALLAAAGIGLSLTGVAYGSESSSISTLLTMRMTYVVVLVAVVSLSRVRLRPSTAEIRPILAVGIIDISANAAFALSTRSGALAVVAVLSSLYPVTTALLARVVHEERLDRSQLVGVVIALGAVAVIVGGGA